MLKNIIKPKWAAGGILAAMLLLGYYYSNLSVRPSRPFAGSVQGKRFMDHTCYILHDLADERSCLIGLHAKYKQFVNMLMLIFPFSDLRYVKNDALKERMSLVEEQPNSQEVDDFLCVFLNFIIVL